MKFIKTARMNTWFRYRLTNTIPNHNVNSGYQYLFMISLYLNLLNRNRAIFKTKQIPLFQHDDFNLMFAQLENFHWYCKSWNSWFLIMLSSTNYRNHRISQFQIFGTKTGDFKTRSVWGSWNWSSKSSRGWEILRSGGTNDLLVSALRRTNTCTV